MMNPILSKLIGGNAQGAGPQMPNLSMLKNHPMYQQAMKFVQDNGGNYQQAFYTYAQQNGIDPSQIADLFK